MDDVTREAISDATDRTLESRQELLDQITERFRQFGVKMSDNNRRQAMVPQGAIAIENPVGTAPIFILETERGVVMTLPGVPREMKHLLDQELVPWLEHYIGAPATIKSLVLRTVGIGESQVDSRIGDLMVAANPTVGLAAHSGQTDIRITAKAPSDEEADALIAPLADELRNRLGSWIYGTGGDRIEDVIVGLLRQHHATVATAEVGTNGLLVERLREASEGDSVTVLGGSFPSGWEGQRPAASDAADWLPSMVWEFAQATRAEHRSDYGLAVAMLVIPAEGGRSSTGVAFAVDHPTGSRKRYFSWGHERPDGPVWATTHALALLRRMILNVEEPTN
jgi:nicotinamide mononucleotide (NMN) deamidase PncC